MSEFITHYAEYSQSPAKLMRLGIGVHEHIRNQFPTRNIIYVYRGFSGTSFGTALLFAAGLKKDNKVGGLYIRKAGESEHSSYPEMSMGWTDRFPFETDRAEAKLKEWDPLFIMIDDFVGSGDTIAAMYKSFWIELELSCTIVHPSEFLTEKNNLGLALVGSNLSMSHDEFKPSACKSKMAYYETNLMRLY